MQIAIQAVCQGMSNCQSSTNNLEENFVEQFIATFHQINREKVVKICGSVLDIPFGSTQISF